MNSNQGNEDIIKEYEKSAEDFLMRNGMHPDSIDLDVCLKPYLSEMEKGLKEDNSMLLMQPMYIKEELMIEKNSKAIAMDIGGTNIRIAVIHLDSKANLTIEKYRNYKMPGTEQQISKDVFFNKLASYLEPFMTQAKRIGISFAYETKILPNLDGRIISLSKEVQISGAEGELIGENIKKALKQRGVVGVEIAVTNDSIAAALSGLFGNEDYIYDGALGVIVGTGTNSCYIENNISIKQMASQDGHMFINVESGNFNHIPKGKIDSLFFQTTKEPETAALEKMVSGRYIGGIYYHTVRHADRHGLFTSAFTEGFAKCNELPTIEMSRFLKNPRGDSVYANLCENEMDRVVLSKLGELLVIRAAKLIALQIGGAAIKSKRGKQAHKPLCVVVEGTTFYELAGLKAYTEVFVEQWLKEKYGVNITIKRIEDAILKGAGIIGIAGNEY